MDDSIAKLRGDFIEKAKASSHARLKMKKHQALVDLVKSVQPGLRQHLERRWQQLEQDENTRLEEELKEASDDSSNLAHSNGEDIDGNILERTLYQSLSPMLQEAGIEPTPTALQTPQEGSSHMNQNARREQKRKRHISPHALDNSDSSGDPDEEIEARPRSKNKKLHPGSQATLDELEHSGEGSHVASQAPGVRPRSTPTSTSSPSSSAQTLMEATTSHYASSNRSGLRRATKAQGSYNAKEVFRKLGLSPNLKKSS
ncbi:hypothetical protein AB5N19_08306 [Seiridium cardinale]|uniref:Uncharacterized protein n=1 Tax=Seiridium cardinale TaxID=138064 RepID=A0ABR2XB95_9PEZI